MPIIAAPYATNVRLRCSVSCRFGVVPDRSTGVSERYVGVRQVLPALHDSDEVPLWIADAGDAQIVDLGDRGGWKRDLAAERSDPLTRVLEVVDLEDTVTKAEPSVDPIPPPIPLPCGGSLEDP